MIPPRLFPHTVDIVHPDTSGTDQYHQPVLDYAGGTTDAGVKAFVQPVSQEEVRADQDTTVTRWKIFADTQALSSLDRVVWDGKTYEVDGDTAIHSTPRGEHHRTALLRHVSG